MLTACLPDPGLAGARPLSAEGRGQAPAMLVAAGWFVNRPWGQLWSAQIQSSKGQRGEASRKEGSPR